MARKKIILWLFLTVVSVVGFSMIGFVRPISVLCDGDGYRLADIECGEWVVFKRISIEANRSTQGLERFQKHLNVPFFLLEKPLKNFFSSHTLLTLDVPVTISDGLSTSTFVSWVRIQTMSESQEEAEGAGTLLGIRNRINYIKTEDRYRLLSSTDSYLIYEQVKPKLITKYVIPQDIKEQDIYFDCIRNCSAYTVIGSFIVRFSFPYDKLDDYEEIQQFFRNLISSTFTGENI